MRARLKYVAVAVIAAGAFGFWLNSTGRSDAEVSLGSKPPAPVPLIDFWNVHNQAHQEFLPVN
jgi:hypothetical protein